MSQNLNLSFEGGQVSEPLSSQINSLPNFIRPFSSDSLPSPKKYNFAIFGVPLDNPKLFPFEKRPGCDMAAFSIAKFLKKSVFSIPKNIEESTNLISFLDTFETQHLSVIKAGTEEFYKEEIVQKVVSLLNYPSLTLLAINGGIDFALRQTKTIRDSLSLKKPFVIKISPFEYSDFCDDSIETLHIGLDPKFSMGKKGDNLIYFNALEGANSTKNSVKAAVEGDIDLMIILDCQVLSSDYFEGTSTPMPFSFSKREIIEILEIIFSQKSKIKSFAVCHYNPTIEELRSPVFITEILYRLIVA